MSGRTFTADYERKNLTSKVWFPLGLAAVLGIGGLIIGEFVMSTAAAVFTFIALRSWPLTRFDKPALFLSSKGAEIDGLGLVKWHDISAANKGVVQIKTQKIPALDVEFRRSLPEVFNPSGATRLRPWEFRIFKLRKDGKLRLDLSKLAEDADEVEAAFRYFMSGGVR